MSKYFKLSVFSVALAFLFMTSLLTTSSQAQFGDEGFPNTVFAILPESPGSNCANGGSLIASGLDLNGSGNLNFNEVQFIGYACNGDDGAQGPQGATGPAGPVGPVGAIGPQGPAGAVGATGPQGVAGPTGPQGPAGNDGAVGATGPQGPQGDQGDAGPAGNDGADGADGSDGANALVLEGGIEPLCPNGRSFIYGTDLNGDGDLNDTVQTVDPNGVITAAVELDGEFDVCDGDDGAQGATGPTGPEGPSGPNGTWAAIRTNTCPGGTIATNNTCIYETFCAVGGTAISGMCGDAGNADDILVQYSGRDRTNPRRWQCTVRNFSRQDRSVSLGIYCVP